MRKRIQRIHDGHVELTISRHAIERFRARVARIRPDLIPGEIARMMRSVTPIYLNARDDNKIYLAHEECVFVIARRSGVLVTVLPAEEGKTGRFSGSYKDTRAYRSGRKPPPKHKHPRKKGFH